MNSLSFKQDAGLTTAFTLLAAGQGSDGAAPAVDRVAYLGSTAVGKKFQAVSNPGVAQIAVMISDLATGLQLPATSIKLASTQAGLAAAVAGSALAVGTEILSGAEHAVPVWIRIDAAATAGGIYDNLGLVTSSTVEVAA